MVLKVRGLKVSKAATLLVWTRNKKINKERFRRARASAPKKQRFVSGNIGYDM